MGKVKDSLMDQLEIHVERIAELEDMLLQIQKYLEPRFGCYWEGKQAIPNDAVHMWHKINKVLK